jgi:hypothetical protein
VRDGWAIIQSCIGALFVTFLVGAFTNLSSWSDISIVFIVFAFGIYFTILKAKGSN